MRRLSRIAIAAGALAAALNAGCYQRTIRAEGPAASRTNVQEPYQANWLVDDLLFGQEAKNTRSGSGKR